MKEGEEKVPGLGDLPLIGGLFRYRTRSKIKTNLMVFLRPTLIRTPESAKSITGDRYDYLRGEQLKSKPAPSKVLPNFEPPTLPPRQGATPAQTRKATAQTGKSAAETGNSLAETSRSATDGDDSPFPAQDR